MLSVGLLLGEFPALHWWIIEFGIAYLLDTYISDRLVRCVHNYWPDRTPQEEQAVYLEVIRFEYWHALLFAGSNLGLGLALLVADFHWAYTIVDIH